MVQFDEQKLAIIYEPKCEMINSQELCIFKSMKKTDSIHNIHRDVMQMFECIEDLNRLGIIHRNIHPQHFMRRLDNGEIVLVDFGSAIFLPESSESSYLEECLYFEGSLEFAAIEILLSVVVPET